MSSMQEFKVDKLHAVVYENEIEMGKAAAYDAATEILRLQKEQDEINIIFAAAVSQNEFLNALKCHTDIDWSKINAFHMDEYVGLEGNSPESLAEFLRSHFLNKVNVKRRFFMNSSCESIKAECERYSALLEKYPCDLVFLGIGDNGHLAFNDPHVADFTDKAMVKVVDIDNVSKQQQVNAGNFKSISAVPSMAFTVTIPALLKAKKKLCIVPTEYKAEAVKNTIYANVSEACPSTILRTCDDVKLYLEPQSAKYL